MAGKERKRPVTDLLLEHGKVPPQAVDLEEVILGALIIESESTESKKAVNIVKAEYFYKEAHQIIFSAIHSLYEKDYPIDLLSVNEELRNKGELDLVGGPYYVAMLISRISSSRHILYHSYIVHKKYIQRELIHLFSDEIRKSYEDTEDPLEQIEYVAEKMNDLRISKFNKISEDAQTAAEKFEDALFNEEGKQSAIYLNYNTGHKRLDMFASWGLAKIYLVGGEAKHGKTKFVSDILFRLLKNHKDNVAVKWFSLEDPTGDILAGYCSSKIFVSAENLKNRNFDRTLDPTIKDHLEKFKEYDVDLYDNSISISDAIGQFEVFCTSRTDKLCICVIDNLLSLTDKDRFENNIAGLTDYVLGKVLEGKQRTKGMFIVLHHFKVEHMKKENIDTGYRPTLMSLKGSDAVKRVPNAIFLVNYPTMHKDLIGQYSDDAKDNLSRLFIVDGAAARGIGNSDDKSLIHMFGNLDFNLFQEVELKEREPGEKVKVEKKYNPDDPVPF